MTALCRRTSSLRGRAARCSATAGTGAHATDGLHLPLDQLAKAHMRLRLLDRFFLSLSPMDMRSHCILDDPWLHKHLIRFFLNIDPWHDAGH